MEYDKVQYLMGRIRQHIKGCGAEPLSKVYDQMIETVLLKEEL